MDRTRGKDLGLDAPLRREETAAMVIGLKLLGEVALVRRKDEFFAEIREALGQFVRQLKARPEVGQGQQTRA